MDSSLSASSPVHDIEAGNKPLKEFSIRSETEM